MDSVEALRYIITSLPKRFLQTLRDAEPTKEAIVAGVKALAATLLQDAIDVLKAAKAATKKRLQDMVLAFTDDDSDENPTVHWQQAGGNWDSAAHARAKPYRYRTVVGGFLKSAICEGGLRLEIAEYVYVQCKPCMSAAPYLIQQLNLGALSGQDTRQVEELTDVCLMLLMGQESRNKDSLRV